MTNELVKRITTLPYLIIRGGDGVGRGEGGGIQNKLIPFAPSILTLIKFGGIVCNILRGCTNGLGEGRGNTTLNTLVHCRFGKLSTIKQT